MSYAGPVYKVQDPTGRAQADGRNRHPHDVHGRPERINGPSESLIRWRRAGMGMLVTHCLTWGVLEKPLEDLYKKRAPTRGHQPNIVYIRPVYLDEDEKQFERGGRRGCHNSWRLNASPGG